MPNIDNPWPDRQDRDDHEASKFEKAHEFWIARNRQMALEILSAQYELEREYENEFNCSMDGGMAELFNISRADVRHYEATNGRRAI